MILCNFECNGHSVIVHNVLNYVRILNYHITFIEYYTWVILSDHLENPTNRNTLCSLPFLENIEVCWKMQSIALTALTAIAGTSISIHFWSASDFSSRPRLTWLIPTGSSVVFSDNYLCHLTWKIQGLGFPWKDVWCNVWYGKHCRQHWWRQTCSLVKWCNMLDVFINCTHTCRQRNNFEIFLCAHVSSWRWLVHTGSFFLQWPVISRVSWVLNFMGEGYPCY